MAAFDDRIRAARDLFARNMRRLRRERGLTQEGLSGDSGLRQSYLSEVESGRRNISLDAMATIAAAMRMPIASLFEEQSLARSTGVDVEESPDETRPSARPRRPRPPVDGAD